MVVVRITSEVVENTNELSFGEGQGYATQHGIWVNFFGQIIQVDHYSHFQAYLEVRQGRPVNPMSPSRRGVIKDEALNRLCDFIRDSLFEYFSRAPIEDIDPLALVQFYRDYPAQSSKQTDDLLPPRLSAASLIPTTID